jgi:hypothetical protein
MARTVPINEPVGNGAPALGGSAFSGVRQFSEILRNYIRFVLPQNCFGYIFCRVSIYPGAKHVD